MLHKETLEPATLELIRRLQADSILGGFELVGGTALALMIGHRVSVDINLFSQHAFDAQEVLEHLEKAYGFSLQYMHKNTLKGVIDHVFVDVLTHAYPKVGDIIVSEGIALISKQDIAAMKINAISGNGTRAKDFVDVYFLLKEYSVGDLLGFYSQKYAQRNTFHALKSLTWFDDMDEAAWPNMLLEKNLTPAILKKEITRHVTAYARTL